MSLDLMPACKRWLGHVKRFSRELVGRPLYDYQLAPAQAIIDSVVQSKGLEIAVLFPRQSGKNEIQAHVEAYLLNLYQRRPGALIVKAQPTYLPQATNAKDRLAGILDNGLNRARWRPRHDHQIMLGEAGVTFLSASGQAQVAGASATLLLEVDEAQDVPEAVWDRLFAPMAASQNATVVYWGTAWNSHTLLARTIRRLRALERKDGQPRVFVVSPEEVSRSNPAYGQYVFKQIERLGRYHPTVRSQYFNEEIDADTGMFPTARRALMRGWHRRQESPDDGKLYALLVDVAGGAESQLAGPSARSAGHAQVNPRHDRTALTVVEVDLSSLQDELIVAPTYRAVFRKLWTDTPHTELYGALRGLALHWRARHVVVDATGLGHGLAAFLTKALPPETVIPLTFTAATKSNLGWRFMSLCDARRWQDYELGAYDADGLTFWKELEFCQYQVRPGPNKSMRWGVPDGTRDPDGQPVHDDTIISAALATVLDEKVWRINTGPAVIIWARDPLDEMSRGY